MRTLIVSDLHLGAASREDVLRDPALREPLLEEIRRVDRLVLLGDALELRDRAERDAAGAAAPFLADVGRALGPDGELVLVGGNHDHGLVAGWIDGRLLTERPGFLGLEQRFAPADAGRLAAALAEHARPARTTVAYPGLWLRDDVYAIHGHYSDLHTTVPTFERLAAGAMARWIVRLPERGATADDYEAVLAPIYAWLHAVAQRADDSAIRHGGGASARVWVALAGGGRGRLRRLALAGGYLAAVAALNAAGLGPLDRDLRGGALRRGGLRGMREALRRLDVTAPHVVFGHSHRPGPLAGDDPAEWTTHAGGRLHNTGSWVHQPHFLGRGPADSPYWPGTAVLVEDDAPPRLLRLLDDRSAAELSARVRA
jgi:Calcineurin-like phosphoesterase